MSEVQATRELKEVSITLGKILILCAVQGAVEGRSTNSIVVAYSVAWLHNHLHKSAYPPAYLHVRL